MALCGGGLVAGCGRSLEGGVPVGGPGKGSGLTLVELEATGGPRAEGRG